MPDILLYAYWRSAASYRVRAALALKGLEATEIEVDLSVGAQKGSEYRRINPQAIVPTLVHDGRVIHQSLAIIEYLNEVFPERPLLPADPSGRARVRAIAMAVAAEIQGRMGTRVREYIEERWDAATMRDWYKHWGRVACEGVEGLLADHPDTGDFCHGDMSGMADCFLYPQVCALRRREVDLTGFPTMLRIADACAAESAFIAAAPENHAGRTADTRF